MENTNTVPNENEYPKDEFFEALLEETLYYAQFRYM